MKISEALNVKIFIHGSGSARGEQVELGLPFFLICCAILPSEVLIIIGVVWALLKLWGQISQTQNTGKSKLAPELAPSPSSQRQRKAPSKLAPDLPPGLSAIEPPWRKQERPVRPRQSRAHTTVRQTVGSHSSPEPIGDIKVLSQEMVESEARVFAALEAYEAVSGAPPVDLHKEKLPPVPDPTTSLRCLSSNLLGNVALPSGDLADRVEEVLLGSLPQIRIFHFTRTSGTHGNSIPYLQVVIFVRSDAASTSCLQERLQRCTHRAKDCSEQFSAEKFQKSVLRHCLNLLVNQGFKYRRSAFTAESPTVLMLAPAEYTDGSGNVAVEISVNNPLPFLNAALVHEASKVDKRASALVSSVQRWADARALAHVGHGPLSMYGWAHLAIFYLQTRARSPMPLLASRNAAPWRTQPPSNPAPDQAPPPDACLFQGFFEFLYEESFWKSGSVFLRGNSPQGHEVFIRDAFRPDVDLGLQVCKKSNVIARIREDALSALKHFSTSGTVADLLAQPDSESVAASGLNTGWARVGVGELLSS